VRSCQISKTQNNCLAPLHMGGTTLLTKRSLKMLHSKAFVRRLVRDRIAPVASGQILSHLVWNNAEMDTLVFKCLIDWIDRVTDLADVIDFIIDPLMQLRDSLHEQRLTNYCSVGLMGNFLTHKDDDSVWTFELVAYCARLTTYPDRQLQFVLCDHWDDIGQMYMWINNNLWTRKEKRATQRRNNPAAAQKSAQELQDEDQEDEYYDAQDEPPCLASRPSLSKKAQRVHTALLTWLRSNRPPPSPKAAAAAAAAQEDGEPEEGASGDDDVDQESDTTTDDENEQATAGVSGTVVATSQSNSGALPRVAAIVIPAASDAGASQSSPATAAVRPARLPLPQPASASVARALMGAPVATPLSVPPSACVVEEIDSEEDDPDLAAALAASLQ